MNFSGKIKTFGICLIFVCLYFFLADFKISNNDVNRIYNVYLSGDKIGSIHNRDELYALIDEKQKVVKENYNVKNVYPPNSLEVIEEYSYNTSTSDVEKIYRRIEEMQDFTIEGYEIKFSKTSDHEEFSIYVLNPEIFKTALQNFILAFVDEEDFQKYMTNTQEELDDIGMTYKEMGIVEDISIRKKYISINEKIYLDSDELSQHLLFGFNYKEQNYTVKEGDTIESISEDHTLNTQEFLIANPRFSSKDSLLAIGDKVNITLINPELAFEYTVYEMKEVEYAYDKTTVRDNTKEPGYKEITTPGVTGLSIITSHYRVVNGEPDSEAIMDGDPIVVREKVDQVTTIGRKEINYGWEVYNDLATEWKWPTQDNYMVTSEYAPRWGKYHNGLDISGTGWGSRIYAANGGVVVDVFRGCANNGKYPDSCGRGYGNYVVIQHSNNIFTMYAHLLNNVPVNIGQTVNAKQVIGYMGNSGQSKGTHLHFGVSNGSPFGGAFINPRSLYK